MEHLIVKKLTGAIFGFKNGSKSATEVQGWLDRLKKVNALLAEDFDKKFVAAARERSLKAA